MPPGGPGLPSHTLTSVTATPVSTSARAAHTGGSQRRAPCPSRPPPVTTAYVIAAASTGSATAKLPRSAKSSATAAGGEVRRSVSPSRTSSPARGPSTATCQVMRAKSTQHSAQRVK
ncbi:hypothetical protein AN219_16860 [Streptomyces nanshensis]|nr:hypothetical protein AN219_16860 [Streptomyces nanshensis]